jgi:23S rRNA (cytidine1920-2'-O)/16S rRNA (cytidine1409-2'-O)-methyltransferase
MVLMVKPQFEVGRAAVGDGVVRDSALRASAVRGVGDTGLALGLRIGGVTASPLPGPSGNVEYFLWLTRGSGRMGTDGHADLAGDVLQNAIDRAVREGPQ